jgi:cytochrome c5
LLGAAAHHLLEDTMSDNHAQEENHEGPIRTPKQLIWTVLASFVLPVIIIILLVNYVAFDNKSAPGSDAFTAEAVAKRLQPVGTVEYKDVNNVAAMKTGQQVYDAQCSACHASGAAGAPKAGDAAAWAPRVATGFDALWGSVLKGKGAMGAQGGGDYSDFEVARAVVYLANQGGAKFDEPKAPAAAASAPN